MKRLLLLILVFAAVHTFGQKNQEELTKAKAQIKLYSDVYFKFTVSNKSDLANLPIYISIDNVKGNMVYAYVHEKNFQKLLSLNLPFEVVSKTSQAKALTMATTEAQMANWDRYPTYSVYVQMMHDYATNYSSICRLDTIGTTQQGRLLLALKITDNPDVNEDEPEFLYTAQMHGDELVDGVLALHMIDYLLKNYGTNAEVTNLVNNVEIWINPYANPDGTYHGSDNDVTNATRYYYSGDDPNRNFPNPVQGQHPDGSTWNLETTEWMAFAPAHHFVMSVNTHSGAEVFNFPWDSWTTAEKTHADDNWWQYIGHEFADTVFANSTGYLTGVSSNGIIEGADWYYAFGSRQDYFTYYLLGREVTIELSNTKNLDASLLPAYWNYSYRSFLNYLKESLYGIHGIITDACNGQPIAAKVFVNSHDRDSSHVFSSLPVGDYHRPIYAGTYSVTYSATGYQSQTITGITVANQAAVVENVSLTPLPPVANFVADETSGCNATVHFTDQSQSPSGSTYLWNFGDGQTSTSENPVHTYTTSGTYTVSLTVHNSCSGDNTKTQTNYITISLPEAPVTTNDNLCNSGIANLTASGTGTLYWFDAPQGGNQVDTGTVYHPGVTSTTTYYVENHIPSPSIYGGDTRNNTSGGFLSSSTAHYLIFDCYVPTTLVSVQVNAQSQGNRIIQLKNSSGTVLQSDTVTIPAGISTVTLNFNLPVANGLRLVGPTNAALYRNNSGSSYPYNIGNMISITGNSAGNLNNYYYFYNWEVKGPDCISVRVPSTAIVNTPPVANAGQDIQISTGTSAQLNGTASNGSGNYSYHWEPASMVSDANIANPTTVNLSANQAFVLSVTDLTTGCSGIDTVQVTVSSNVLTVNINPSDNNICSGSVVQLTTQVFGGTGSYTYIWSSTPAGFSSAIASPTVNPTESTVYYVTVSDGSSQGTASVNINVLPLPLAAFSYSANQLNVTFTSTSTNVSTFNWNFGDGNNSNVQNPSHTYSQTGDYIVVLIATNSCGSDTVQQTIHVESSGIETNGLSNVNIYPNPVKDILTVAFDKEQPAVISIISFDGRQLLTNDYLSKQCTVDITSLEQGIYVIVIKTGQGILKQMFVKER